jgi:hypothetical protein
MTENEVRELAKAHGLTLKRRNIYARRPGPKRTTLYTLDGRGPMTLEDAAREVPYMAREREEAEALKRSSAGLRAGVMRSHEARDDRPAGTARRVFRPGGESGPTTTARR